MKNIKKIFTVLLINGLIHLPAFAANDGQLSSTSLGTVGITMAIPPRVKISGLSDITINVPSVVTDYFHMNITGTVQFCVYSNIDESGTYRMSARGSGSNGEFTLTNNENENSIAYGISYMKLLNGELVEGAFPLTDGNIVEALGGRSPSFIDCTSNNAHNAEIILTLNNADVVALQSGNYGGTLMLTVEP